MKYTRSNYLTTATAISASLLFTACGEKKDDPTATPADPGVSGTDVRDAVPDLNTLIISLPSSIASSSSGSLHLAPGEEGDGLTSMMLMPRMMLGMANEFTAITKDIGLHLFGKTACTDDDPTNDPSDCSEYGGIVADTITTEWRTFTIPEAQRDEGPAAVKFRKNPDGSDYAYTFYLYWQSATDNLYYPAIEFNCTKTGETAGKGKVLFFPSLIGEGDDGAPGQMMMLFEGTAAARTLEVSLAGMTSEDDADQPSKIVFNATEAGGIVTSAGVVLRDALPEGTTPEDAPFAPFNTHDSLAYTFKIAADATENKAIEEMAILEEDDFTSTTAFTDHAVDAIMQNALVALFRDPDSAMYSNSNAFACTNAGVFITTMAANNICYDNTAVTDAQVWEGVVDFCEIPANNEDPDGLCPSVTSFGTWSNPLYLDSTGLIGTATYNAPTGAVWTTLTAALADVTEVSIPDVQTLVIPAPTGVTAVE